MYDAGKILAGLAVFLVILTAPFWYTAAMGKAAEKPKLVLPQEEKKCVESKEFMRVSHMDLLNQWRDAVVRDGEQEYISSDGMHYKMSLTNTCMKCHTDKAQFCDKCHGYVSMNAFCWDCHVDRKEVK